MHSRSPPRTRLRRPAGARRPVVGGPGVADMREAADPGSRVPRPRRRTASGLARRSPPGMDPEGGGAVVLGDRVVLVRDEQIGAVDRGPDAGESPLTAAPRHAG